MNYELATASETLNTSPEICFYTVTDIMAMTHWSEKTVQKLFRDPKFPSSDFGRTKVIEAHALMNYFSVRHEKAKDKHWRNT